MHNPNLLECACNIIQLLNRSKTYLVSIVQFKNPIKVKEYYSKSPTIREFIEIQNTCDNRPEIITSNSERFLLSDFDANGLKRIVQAMKKGVWDVSKESDDDFYPISFEDYMKVI